MGTSNFKHDRGEEKLPRQFTLRLQPFQYLDVGGNVTHDLAGIYVEQYFREQVIMFKVPKGVAVDEVVTLRCDDADVVGDEPTKHNTKRCMRITTTAYDSMKKDALRLTKEYLKLTGPRVTVRGDGWCWAYALCVVMGVPLEHVLEVALEEEHQKEQASTERDKDMVGAFLELLKVHHAMHAIPHT